MTTHESLPDGLGPLADEVIACSRLGGARRARLAADLREHLEDAVLAGHSSVSIARTFGDPALVGALVRRSPPPARSAGHLRLVAAACVLVAAGAYGMSAARLGTFRPEPEVAPGVLPSRADSLARALRIVRAAKGVHQRSLGARLLEPVYFVRASSVDDVWAATRSVASD